MNLQPKRGVPDVEPHFMRRVSPEPNSGCWLWLGNSHENGYGRYGKGPEWAHRVAYELFQGPIPEHLELDHLCRNRGCVNPSHLEPVTSAINTQRGCRAQQTECIRGHGLPLHQFGVKRNCVICRADRQKANQPKRNAQQRARRAAKA